MSVAAAGKFSPVCEVDDLPIGQPVAINYEGESLCALRTDAGVRVFADRCPHRGHPLSEGACDGAVLRCALHGWEFSVVDGLAVSPAAPFGLDLREIRLRDGWIEIEGDA